MTGNRVVSKMSPATITSDRRKNTMESPSVWAAGWWSTSMPSPLRYTYRRPDSNVSVGQAAKGNGEDWPVGALIRFNTFSAASIATGPLKMKFRGNSLAIASNDVWPARRNGLVAADVIRVSARVDDVSNRTWRDFPDRRNHRVGRRPPTPVSTSDHAVAAHLNGDVAAGAGNHVEIGPDLERPPVAGGRRGSVRLSLSQGMPRRVEGGDATDDGEGRNRHDQKATAEPFCLREMTQPWKRFCSSGRRWIGADDWSNERP